MFHLFKTKDNKSETLTCVTRVSYHTWNKRIDCSELTVLGADVDSEKCTVQIPFDFVWTVREQRPAGEKS